MGAKIKKNGIAIQCIAQMTERIIPILSMVKSFTIFLFLLKVFYLIIKSNDKSISVLPKFSSPFLTALPFTGG